MVKTRPHQREAAKRQENNFISEAPRLSTTRFGKTSLLYSFPEKLTKNSSLSSRSYFDLLIKQRDVLGMRDMPKGSLQNLFTAW